jgi:hypothetical protein
MNNHITFEQFKNSFEQYQTLVDRFEEKDFNVLWIDDYYDGMLLGMLEYQNNKFRFEIISDHTENQKQRIFAIVTLKQSQIDEETYWNNLFKQYVGNHNNFDSNEELKQQPQSMHHLFYDKYRRRDTPNYDSNIVKGWFIRK